MAFFNFIDTVGPAVSALFLNAVDAIRNAISATVNGNVTVNTPASGVAVTINGASAQTALLVNVNGTSVNGAVNVTGNVPNGSVPFEISNTDTGANSGALLSVNSGSASSLILESSNGTPTIGNVLAGAAQALIGLGAVPLYIGANHIAAIKVDESGGGIPAVAQFGTVANAWVDSTIDSGTFTFTATGGTGTLTGTAFFVRIGKLVLLFVPSIIITSTATTFTFVGLPASIIPATMPIQTSCTIPVSDNSATTITGSCSVAAGSNVVTWYHNGASGWTASGLKGTIGFCFPYLIT